MDFFEDTLASRSLIEELIQKFGYAPEHNFYWYTYYCDLGYRNVFVRSDRGGLCAAVNDKTHEWGVDFDPLALPKDRAPLLVEYVEWMFNNTKTEKIWFQLEESNRRDFLNLLPDHYHANAIRYSYVWPITDLRVFDPELPGGHYKTIRKEMHRFYREHTVSVQDAKTYEDKVALRAVVDGWKNNRRLNDALPVAYYDNAIDANFKGMEEARVLIVDGRPVGINAGYIIPNRDRYYGAIGVHDYSLDGLGTMLYLEDLIWLKKAGYREVDMGGSEKWLLAFKKKFGITSSYKTFSFSVTQRKN